MKIRNILLIFISLWFLLYLSTNLEISCMERGTNGIEHLLRPASNTELDGDTQSILQFLNHQDAIFYNSMRIPALPPISHRQLLEEIVRYQAETPLGYNEFLDAYTAEPYVDWHRKFRYASSTQELRLRLDQFYAIAQLQLKC